MSEYVGGGLIGQIAEALDTEERFKADVAHANWVSQKGKIKAMEKRISEIEKYTKAITRAVLLVSGYHSHKRQWRKARNV